MLTLHQRKRLGATIHGLQAHQRNTRECANDQDYQSDDPLSAARGIWRAVVWSLPAWGVFAAIVLFAEWCIRILMGAQ